MSNFISQLKTSYLFQYIRKLKYRNQRKKLANKKLLTIKDLENILVNQLDINDGDSIMVHCGFGFLNAKFSPIELINLLKKLVGDKGNIMMPFYPPGLSSNWAQSRRAFDPKTVKSSTGVLAQEFSDSDGVVISNHPIKAVAVWGNKANELVSSHEQCNYPFDITSPYYKLAMLPESKSIGLGVRNCAMLHCAEDLYEEKKGYLYTLNKVELAVVNGAYTHVVPTFYHHGNTKLLAPFVFIDRHCKMVVKCIIDNETTYYSLKNKLFLDLCADLFKNGVNRKCL